MPRKDFQSNANVDEVTNLWSKKDYYVITEQDEVLCFYSTVIVPIILVKIGDKKRKSRKIPCIHDAIAWFVRYGIEEANGLHEDVVRAVRLLPNSDWHQGLPEFTLKDSSGSQTAHKLWKKRASGVICEEGVILKTYNQYFFS